MCNLEGSVDFSDHKGALKGCVSVDGQGYNLKVDVTFRGYRVIEFARRIVQAFIGSLDSRLYCTL